VQRDSLIDTSFWFGLSEKCRLAVAAYSCVKVYPALLVYSSETRDFSSEVPTTLPDVEVGFFVNSSCSSSEYDFMVVQKVFSLTEALSPGNQELFFNYKSDPRFSPFFNGSKSLSPLALLYGSLFQTENNSVSLSQDVASTLSSADDYYDKCVPRSDIIRSGDELGDDNGSGSANLFASAAITCLSSMPGAGNSFFFRGPFLRPELYSLQEPRIPHPLQLLVFWCASREPVPEAHLILCVRLASARVCRQKRRLSAFREARGCAPRTLHRGTL
jgi:hypothetical protein